MIKDKNLFDIDYSEKIIKKFTPKDMFFNNGIVNLYQFLKDKNFDIEINFDDNGLELKMNSQKSEEIYFEILQDFFKKHKIIYQTKNDRWYFDEKKQDFVIDKKFDTKGGQKNDLRNGVYLYKNISEFGLSREDAEELYLGFCERYGMKPERESGGKLKVPNKKNDVIVAITLDEAIRRFTEYFVNSNTLSIDSKIHSFEDGQDSFQDMLKQPKNYKIDKWDALIYWFGGRIQRFYNYSYFIYPNSSNMKALYEFKKFLQIRDEKTIIRDEKTDKLKEIGTNIDFFKTLSKDGIVNKNFYISKSEEEFEVKFFMYLFSTIYHIEERYDKVNDRRRARSKALYDALLQIIFVIYTDDGTFKTSFDEYTKAYKLIQFFKKTKEIKEKDLFRYLAHLFVVFSLSQGNKEVNLNFKNWCQNILNFSNLRKEYYLTSFNILKNSSMGFGENLFEFEQFYLQNILGGKDMDIHEQSKKLGDGIGHFCAKLGDKDLLFKLRNIKNYKQMLSYFKDLKFATLKNEKEAKFSKEFNESLEEVLNDIESNWEIVRDYIAIYAIDKYKSVSYAKSNQGGK